MITLIQDHHAISGNITTSDFMIHKESKELSFQPYFSQWSYSQLEWESESDMIVFLDAYYNRNHFIYDDSVLYADGTIYSQYFATIERL